MTNPRLKELAVKLSAHMLEKLNETDSETLKKMTQNYEQSGTVLDSGIAQVLRLYQTARTIGAVASRKWLKTIETCQRGKKSLGVSVANQSQKRG